MSTIAEYLALLAALRDELAANLERMGVTADAAEPLQTLVPKVLRIQQGDMRHECCDVVLSQFPCSYGFFAYDETATFAGAVAVNAFYLMRTAKLIIASNISLETLKVTAPGWTITHSEKEIVLETDVQGRSGGEFLTLLDAIQMRQTVEEDLWATVTLEIVGDESGEVVGATGSARLYYQGVSWDALDAHALTWKNIEDEKLTWDGLETLGKPEA